MKKWFCIYVITVLLMLTGQSALAGEAEKVVKNVPSGVYVEATAGYSTVGDGLPSTYVAPKYDGVTHPSISNGGIGYSVALGYQFTDNIGLELGATSYASQHGENDGSFYDKKNVQHNVQNMYSLDTSRSQMYDVAGRFSYPVYQKFDVFAKLGLSYMTRNVDVMRQGLYGNTPTIEYEEYKNKGFGVVYGAGAGYRLTNNASLVVEAIANTPFSNQDDCKNDVTMPSSLLISTGLKYTFA